MHMHPKWMCNTFPDKMQKQHLPAAAGWLRLRMSCPVDCEGQSHQTQHAHQKYQSPFTTQCSFWKYKVESAEKVELLAAGTTCKATVWSLTKRPLIAHGFSLVGILNFCIYRYPNAGCSSEGWSSLTHTTTPTTQSRKQTKFNFQIMTSKLP